MKDATACRQVSELDPSRRSEPKGQMRYLAAFDILANRQVLLFVIRFTKGPSGTSTEDTTNN